MSTREEKLKQRQKELVEKSKGDYKFFIFKEGIVRMRAVQVPSDEEFAKEVIFIFLSKELGGHVSPATFGEPCGFMEAYEKLSKSKDNDEKGLANTFKPKKKYAVLHYRYKDDKGTQPDIEMGVKPALLSNGQYQDLIDLYLDDDNGDFTDPATGYDLKYKRVGKTMTDTEYSILTCKPSKIAKEFKKIYNLDEELRKVTPSYEETKELVAKFLNVQEDEDEDEEAPKKKVKSSTNQGAVKKKKKTTKDI